MTQFSTITFEEKSRLIQYRNNLILSLMEMMGCKQADPEERKGIKEKFKLTNDDQVKILNEIFYLSLWTEQDTPDEIYSLEELQQELKKPLPTPTQDK